MYLILHHFDNTISTINRLGSSSLLGDRVSPISPSPGWHRLNAMRLVQTKRSGLMSDQMAQTNRNKLARFFNQVWPSYIFPRLPRLPCTSVYVLIIRMNHGCCRYPHNHSCQRIQSIFAPPRTIEGGNAGPATKPIYTCGPCGERSTASPSTKTESII